MPRRLTSIVRRTAVVVLLLAILAAGIGLPFAGRFLAAADRGDVEVPLPSRTARLPPRVRRDRDRHRGARVAIRCVGSRALVAVAHGRPLRRVRAAEVRALPAWIGRVVAYGSERGPVALPVFKIGCLPR